MRIEVKQDMSSFVMRRLFASEIVKLLPILALACYFALIPHLDDDYPVHVDEWAHLTYTKALQEAESIDFTEPFPTSLYPTDVQDPEIGYHVFLSMFQDITGISWLTFFKYFPSIVFMITVLSIYILGRREGYGWPAALAACLIPTSVGILGPAFMVPMAVGLLFIPLCLFLAFNFRTWASYLLLFILSSFLLILHPPTAIALLIIFVPYILLNLKSNVRHSLKTAMAIGAPFLALLILFFNSLLDEAKQLLDEQSLEWFVSYPDVLETYGYIPVVLAFLGIIVLAVRGNIKNFGVILGMFALIAVLLVFFRLHYGSPIWYNRGLIYMLLMMSILTGAGLQWVKSKGLPIRPDGKLRHFLAKNSGTIIYVCLIIIIVVIAIPNRLDTNYYQMIDDDEYERFVWIRDNIDESHVTAALNPWKATALVAIADMGVVSRIHSHQAWVAEKTEEFLNNGCENTDFLRRYNVSLIYSQSGCNNPDLVEASEHIYVLRETERE